jgi:hypothetical protein
MTEVELATRVEAGLFAEEEAKESRRKIDKKARSANLSGCVEDGKRARESSG